MDELDVREDLMFGEILTTGHAALFPRVPRCRGIGIGFAGGGGHIFFFFFPFSFLFFGRAGMVIFFFGFFWILFSGDDVDVDVEWWGFLTPGCLL